MIQCIRIINSVLKFLFWTSYDHTYRICVVCRSVKPLCRYTPNRQIPLRPKAYMHQISINGGESPADFTLSLCLWSANLGRMGGGGGGGGIADQITQHFQPSSKHRVKCICTLHKNISLPHTFWKRLLNLQLENILGFPLSLSELFELAPVCKFNHSHVWFVNNLSKKYICVAVQKNVIFILSRYINYKKHKLLRLLADWTVGLQCPPKHWKAARK